MSEKAKTDKMTQKIGDFLKGFNSSISEEPEKKKEPEKKPEKKKNQATR